MKIYLSKSSLSVKLLTIGTLLILSIVVLTLITINENYGLIGGIVLSLLIIGTLIYFYANSLDKIILEKEIVVLKKNIGRIIIPISEIKDIQKLEYSSMTMTYGSLGVFGFIGSTMENSISFVKDRKNMLKIVTVDKKYILSSDNSTELINEIRTALQQHKL